MKHLLEIAKIVTKKKVKKIEIFDDYSLRQKNSKFNDFYEALMAGKFSSDADAAKYLYGSTPSDDKFRQLKSRFKKRLLNTLFFLDVNQPAASNYNRAYYSCNKDWTLVKILLSNKAYTTAAHLARQILNTALKFKFADIIVNCARILREHYALREEDERLYEEYDQYCKQFQNVLDAEIRSEELFQRVAMNYYKPASKNKGLEDKIQIYCQALKGLSEIYESPIVHYNHYLVWAIHYEMLGDYEKMLNICEAAEDYILKNPNYYREDKLGEIGLKKLSALLHLKTKDKKIIEKPLPAKIVAALEKTDVWAEIQEYHFLLAMHAEAYVKAQEIFYQVIGDKRFRHLTEMEQEKWFVFESYLNYLQNIIPKLQEQKPKIKKRYAVKKFRLKNFLSEPLLYSRSGRMFMILQMITQVLFFIEEGNWANAFERIERLKSIAYRQMRAEEQFRTIQFIRLLQQLAKADFDFEKIGVHQKYLDRLKEETFRYRGLLTELEIIPYLKLWSLVLERIALKRIEKS
jgi:hypothetical protein